MPAKADPRFFVDFQPDASPAIGSCQHPPGARYWDTDEWRCRECARSIPFAPLDTSVTEPEPEPRSAKPLVVACLQCKAEIEVKHAGPVVCGCGLTLFHVGVDGTHRLPDFDPPRLLRCSCCKEEKPQFCFGGATRNTYREGRANQCRGCAAFQRRIKRQQRGPEITERDRLRAKEYREKMTPEQRARYRTPKEAVNAAHRRWYARKAKGRPVPKQRAGRIPLLVKPTCRIEVSCPLRTFCTVENKGLA